MNSTSTHFSNQITQYILNYTQAKCIKPRHKFKAHSWKKYCVVSQSQTAVSWNWIEEGIRWWVFLSVYCGFKSVFHGALIAWFLFLRYTLLQKFLSDQLLVETSNVSICFKIWHCISRNFEIDIRLYLILCIYLLFIIHKIQIIMDIIFYYH